MSPAPERPAEAVESAPLLERIRGPQDVRDLPAEELPRLCAELRAFLLDSVQATGGHLGSNLGVVELTVALHRVFDFRRDRLVLDTSHQGYPHKVLTGRRERFPTLRQTGGLCGFTNPEESEYDLFHLGHAGTSISLATGLALAQAREAEPAHVVAVIGDASLGAGVAFEGLNHAGAAGARMLVVLNDNEWSISQSVGALARYLSRLRASRTLHRAQQEIGNLIASIPIVGERVERTLDQVREVLRHTIVAGHVFEELGVTYVGPLDGHDVERLVDRLERARELDGVVLLHVLTEKGKGHPDGPTHPERVHATKPPKHVVARATPESDKVAPAPRDDSGTPLSKGQAYTAAFGDALAQLAERDVRVHAITCGMPSGTGLTGFAERFPSRFHDTGITEQHAVAMAAGMAKSGLRPVCAIYSTFLQRAYDQVMQEVALQKLPVTFALDRAGLVGQDGPTHNGAFDIAYLRTLPHLTLCAPRDATDVRRMLELALRIDGPLAVRFPRGECPGRERVPEAGDAEGLAAELGAEEPLLLPLGVLHRPIRRRNAAGERQHQGAGVLRDADAVRTRCVDDENAPRACRGDVDVVHAGAGAGDDAEFRRRQEQIGRHLGRAADEQGVRVGQRRRELRCRPAALRIDLPA